MANIHNLRKKSKDLIQENIPDEADLDSLMSGEARSRQQEDFVSATSQSMSTLEQRESIPEKTAPKPPSDGLPAFRFPDMEELEKDEEDDEEEELPPIPTIQELFPEHADELLPAPEPEEEPEPEPIPEPEPEPEPTPPPAPKPVVEETPLVKPKPAKRGPKPRVAAQPKIETPVVNEELPAAPQPQVSVPVAQSPTVPKSSNTESEDLWMFKLIAQQMIAEARLVIQPDGIDSDKYWDKMLSLVNN